MSQKLPVNNFEWIEDNSQFNEDFIKSYNKESDEEFFPEIVVQYPQKNTQIPFSRERKKIERGGKLVTNLHDETEYFIHMRNLKQALNQGFVFKKVYTVIKVDQIA